MESTGIIPRLEVSYPDDVLHSYQYCGQDVVLTRKKHILDICSFIRDQCAMNHLMFLCAVDNSRRKEAIGKNEYERFEVVYQFYSMTTKHSIRIRAQVPDDDCSIESITSLWPGADCLERECFDLMGIHFSSHPDLRRILMPEDWKGHPLRKEYPLRGIGEWAGYETLKEKSLELRTFDYRSSQKGNE